MRNLEQKQIRQNHALYGMALMMYPDKESQITNNGKMSRKAILFMWMASFSLMGFSQGFINYENVASTTLQALLLYDASLWAHSIATSIRQGKHLCRCGRSMEAQLSYHRSKSKEFLQKIQR